MRLGADELRAAVLSTCSSNRGPSPKRATGVGGRGVPSKPSLRTLRDRVLFHTRTSRKGSPTNASRYGGVGGSSFCPARRDGQEGVVFAPSRRDVTHTTTTPAGALGGPGDTADALGEARSQERKTTLAAFDASTPRGLSCLGGGSLLRCPTYIRCESKSLYTSRVTSAHADRLLRDIRCRLAVDLFRARRMDASAERNLRTTGLQREARCCHIFLLFGEF